MKKDEQLGVSRRSFLKGAGLAAAAMAGTAALAGCANESAGGTDTLANTGDWLPQTWDYECDLLVIGYGGAGMWASLIGADECGQQVLVLEKAPSAVAETAPSTTASGPSWRSPRRSASRTTSAPSPRARLPIR